MTAIKKIEAWEILDSRGLPTIEAKVVLKSDAVGYAAIPSGASTGKDEAVELRDHDMQRYLGKGVLKAVNNINTEIADTLCGMDALDQKKIDKILCELDGTQNCARLGANALLAVSLANIKAAANEICLPLYQYIAEDREVSLPVPMINIINGGAHADNNIDIQEFMIIPNGASDFEQAIRYSSEVFQNLKKILREEGYSTAVGDEGGFAPCLKNNIEALDFILKAIEKSGFIPGDDIALGLDIAATELFSDNKYNFIGESRTFSSEEFVFYLTDLVAKYPILSIEDPMAEDDWPGWQVLTSTLGNKLQIVGDDVFVTNAGILKKGIEKNIANALLVKPNQIGTLTQTLSAVQLAKTNNYGVVFSHRSGETEDTTIADLAVGANAGQIKIGSLCRSERVAKYNRLLRINYELKQRAIYPGKKIFNKFYD